MIDAKTLGCPEFRQDYGLRYAYAAGAMYKGIASVELVTAMSRGGFLAFLGAGGLEPADVARRLAKLRKRPHAVPTASHGWN